VEGKLVKIEELAQAWFQVGVLVGDCRERRWGAIFGTVRLRERWLTASEPTPTEGEKYRVRLSEKAADSRTSGARAVVVTLV